MRLYYGSKTFFTKPIYGEGNITNDYGLGFYMTDSYELAKLWAVQHSEGGYVLTFDFDMNGLNVLNLNSYGEVDVLKWISILVNHHFAFADREKYRSRIEWLNRKFHINLDSVDAVIGYRADDSYFNYSRAFVADELSFEILTEAMRIGKLGIQYVAISKQAFKKITFVKSEYVAHTDEYAMFQKNALEEYRKLKLLDKDANTFLRDLVRKYGD